MWESQLSLSKFYAICTYGTAESHLSEHEAGNTAQEHCTGFYDCHLVYLFILPHTSAKITYA